VIGQVRVFFEKSCCFPLLHDLVWKLPTPAHSPAKVDVNSPIAFKQISVTGKSVEVNKRAFLADAHYIFLSQWFKWLQGYGPTLIHSRIASNRFVVQNGPAFRVVGRNITLWIEDQPGAKLLNKSHSRAIIFQPRRNQLLAADYVDSHRCDLDAAPLFVDLRFYPITCCFGRYSVYYSLPNQNHEGRKAKNDQPPFGPFEGCVPLWRVLVGICGMVAGIAVALGCIGSGRIALGVCLGIVLGEAGTVIWLTGHYRCDEAKRENRDVGSHSGTIVLQKYLDNLYLCSTVIDMANVLNTDKQIAVIGALAEGSSIRSIERITGVHRDTIMRLGVKVGEGCAKLLDGSMRDLPCNRLEMDEIWGFVGKKDRNVREGEDGVGSVWTFCAIDAETKLVPAFKCGNRDAATAKAFVQDVANRMAYRVQISTDGLNAYVAAMQSAFGEFVDYGQIVKTYGHEEVSDNRRYSAPKFVSAEKKTVIGIPDERLISTSYVERLNATTRLHMRRLTRLTLAFSKKRENFEAAVALHFAYYNFVKRHNTLRVTPAMAAGVTGTFWKVGDLLEAAA
jgi:IS1 family transposase